MPLFTSDVWMVKQSAGSGGSSGWGFFAAAGPATDTARTATAKIQTGRFR
jgi:hypothetical protein